ncbi:DUF3016 domain-containing protein [Pseudomarimonas arenosa]|uniref:DUF3016 domain-containing protein n=1 Tax=Pseudomarimonas arenosa TaxID=2774145 RepID=A0AAW3ZQH9_9GAMM|nr:DUF3016 domain-containing protein [Pseudomarimonas arenosa]MBD8526556.1 DUF3016 domain-containing protein [Pseudomarimonas arenosa]
MNLRTGIPLLLGLLLAASSALGQDMSATSVEVEFLNPDEYTDADYGKGIHQREGEANFRQLRKFLQQQAPSYLKPGQRLLVQFTDIDLAGDREPTARLEMRDVRIIRSVYPPKLDFHYRLTDELGNVLREGQASIRDLGFELHHRSRMSDPLRYEKRMLSEWLRDEFVNR